MIVFEQGDWTLEKVGVPSHMVMKHQCQHTITKVSFSVPKVFVFASDARRCWRCIEPIPEEIQALYYLHNWDEWDEV